MSTDNHWKIKYEELQIQHDEFVNDSKELEAELESELKEYKSQLNGLAKKYDNLKEQFDKTTVSSQASQHKAETKINALSAELAQLQENYSSLNRRYRSLENDKDHLENKLRIAEATIADLQDEVEETAELHIIAKTELEEAIKLHREREERLKLQFNESADVSREALQKEKNTLQQELDRIKSENTKLTTNRSEYERKMNLFQASSNRRASIANREGRIANSVVSSRAGSTATSRRGSINEKDKHSSLPTDSNFFSTVSKLLNTTASPTNRANFGSNSEENTTIWLETDAEPEDLFALFLLHNRSFNIHTICAAEGDSALKLRKIQQIIELLNNNNNSSDSNNNNSSNNSNNHINYNYKEIEYIEGLGSTRAFPSDSAQSPALPYSHANLPSSHPYSAYPVQLDSYLSAVKSSNSAAIIISCKPIREILHFYPEIKQNLPEITLFCSNLENFSPLLADYTAEFILSVLNSFKKVIFFDNNANFPNVPAINAQNMPHFHQIFTQNCESSLSNVNFGVFSPRSGLGSLISPLSGSLNGFAASFSNPYHGFFTFLNQFMKNFNDFALENAENQLRSGNNEQKSAQFNTIVTELKNFGDFSVNCSDVVLACVIFNMNFDCFLKKCTISPGQEGNFLVSSVDPAPESKIYCYLELPWQLLEDQLVNFFSPNNYLRLYSNGGRSPGFISPNSGFRMNLISPREESWQEHTIEDGNTNSAGSESAIVLL
jgi:hypothetical protein